MYTITNTRFKHTAEPTIGDLSLSSGQPLRHLDFPTRPHRQSPGRTNQGKSSKHARHFLFSSLNPGRFPELIPVRRQATRDWLPTLDAGDIIIGLSRRFSAYW